MTATDLPVDAGDAILAGRLTWEHKDPFDRVTSPRPPEETSPSQPATPTSWMQHLLLP